MRLLPPLLIAALCLAGSATAGRRNPLYAWTDEGGAVRYTTQLERIPEARRESARIVEPERSAVENAALLPGARIQPRVPISTEEWLEGGLPETAAEPPPVEAKLPDGDATRDLDARILRLEQAIERDQTALKELISDPEAAAELRDSNELAVISQRLPELQAELTALRAERDPADPPDVP